MKKRREIETLARGVCVMGGQILLCRNRRAGTVYLPGGHVEFGETGSVALAREIREEMGCEAKIGAFLGCAEHRFMQKGEPHAEVNLLYRMRVSGISPRRPLPCREAWIEFVWHPLGRLGRSRLEPAVLRPRLQRWLRAPLPGNLATTKSGGEA